MHFSTIVASALALVLATSTVTVSAQYPSDACLTCIIKAALARTPNCSERIVQHIPAVDLDSPPVRACICPLSINSVWMEPCISSNECTAEDVATVFKNIAPLREEACSRPVDAPAAGHPTVGVAPVPTTSYRSPSATPSRRPTISASPDPSATSAAASATDSAHTSVDTAAPTTGLPTLPAGNAGVPVSATTSKFAAGAAIAMAVAFAVLPF
ncbi:hypothetical protein BGZ97_013258 [Linnemannia gamsii]|uniref:Extracellular membrane protein CFEM domain-containing protein n=1 Tax=Linnemannia gamsii TaxID=64522 RepID=A0A9P6R3D1_9FUNG|nr:hypothetical protein BGZ97_013258 [Linnemannia gamsii]